MKNKKSIELPVNIMVIIIISIVIFGLGIGFFANIYQKAETYQKQAEEQALMEIENYLFNPNEKVAIPINTKDIKTSDYQSFGLIINNVYSSGKTFDIEADQGIICSDNIGNNPVNLTVNYLPTLAVQANSMGKALIGIQTENIEKGQCVIPVKVTFTNNEGDLQEHGIEIITLTIK